MRSLPVGPSLSQMLANVEIKARVRDLPRLVSNAERLSGSPGQVVVQTDVFFPVLRGRLKLRDFRDGQGQLIFYDRPDSEGPKLSQYTILPTNDPASLGAVLSQALGVQGTVKKERRVYMVGQTRVHVDHVEGLGNFMELEVESIVECLVPFPRGKEAAPQWGSSILQQLFCKAEEVVLQEQQNPQDGEQMARQLMEELGVREEDLLPGAYLDLLLAGGEPQLPS